MTFPFHRRSASLFTSMKTSPEEEIFIKLVNQIIIVDESQ